MLAPIYKIEHVYDRDENRKFNKYPQERWFIKCISIGVGAVLCDVDNVDRVFRTSKVEDIKVLDNAIKLVTQNSVYWLNPYAEGV